MKVNNQHQQVLWYLINWKSFSLKDIIEDSMFFKFQTRLSDIELEHGPIAERSSKKFINRFKRKCSYFIYDVIDVEQCEKLMEKY